MEVMGEIGVFLTDYVYFGASVVTTTSCANLKTSVTFFVRYSTNQQHRRTDG